MWRNRIPEVERLRIVELSGQCLVSPDGKEALDYLIGKRGLDMPTLEKFRVGYMPPWVRNFDDRKHEFAGRICLPIFNHYDELVALSSRDWRPDASMKFYHEEFDKRFYLYGLNVAKCSIVKYGKVVVVEGEFDVMTLHQYGIDCTVGILGSAPQLHQIAIMGRYCNEIYVVLDSDTAGEVATDKFLKMCSDNHLQAINGVNVIPVYLPEKCDPDDFIKKSGRKEFINLMKRSKSAYSQERGV
jgi:DNA primase